MHYIIKFIQIWTSEAGLKWGSMGGGAQGKDSAPIRRRLSEERNENISKSGTYVLDMD